MTSSPKRRWFRFHLLTAVVMVVFAGIVLGENVITQSVRYGSSGGVFTVEYGGWPIGWARIARLEPDAPFDTSLKRVLVGETISEDRRAYWYRVLDFVIFPVASATIGLAIEYIIRRREARKP